LYGIQ
jgi:hypothetical protein